MEEGEEAEDKNEEGKRKGGQPASGLAHGVWRAADTWQASCLSVRYAACAPVGLAHFSLWLVCTASSGVSEGCGKECRVVG